MPDRKIVYTELRSKIMPEPEFRIVTKKPTYEQI